MSIYKRQESLNLIIPRSVAVIGVGGVGSWLALNLALVGVRELVLVDPDVVEEHNLNRTPFKLSQVGQEKVDAVAELILERRSDTDLLLWARTIEKAPRFDVELAFDCRDLTSPLPAWLQEKVYLIGGYDGSKITFHLNPKPSSVWGTTGQGYRTIPSWLCPPQFIANVLTTFVCSPFLSSVKEERVITYDLFELAKVLVGA